MLNIFLNFNEQVTLICCAQRDLRSYPYTKSRKAPTPVHRSTPVPRSSRSRVYIGCAATVRSYDAARFGAGAGARVFEPYKGVVLRHVLGALSCASIRFRVQASDLTRRTTGFASLIYPLYG